MKVKLVNLSSSTSINTTKALLLLSVLPQMPYPALDNHNTTSVNPFEASPAVLVASLLMSPITTLLDLNNIGKSIASSRMPSALEIIAPMVLTELDWMPARRVQTMVLIYMPMTWIYLRVRLSVLSISSKRHPHMGSRGSRWLQGMKGKATRKVSKSRNLLQDILPMHSRRIGCWLSYYDLTVVYLEI